MSSVVDGLKDVLKPDQRGLGTVLRMPDVSTLSPRKLHPREHLNYEIVSILALDTHLQTGEPTKHRGFANTDASYCSHKRIARRDYSGDPANLFFIGLNVFLERMAQIRAIIDGTNFA